MSRVDGWTDGAEYGDTLYFTSVSSASVEASTAQARSGDYSYLIPAGNSATKTIDTAIGTLYLRFCVYIDPVSGGDQTSMVRLLDASGNLLIRLDVNTASGIWTARRSTTSIATSTGTTPTDTWLRMEAYVYIDDAAGRVDLRYDGVQILTFTGDTKPGTATTVKTIAYAPAGIVADNYYDDLALDDADWCGDGKIELIVPDAEGDSTQWTPSAGDNWECVNEIPPSAADYVQTSTAGHLDLYNVEAFDSADKTIRRVWVDGRALGTVGGEQVKLAAKTGGTVYYGDTETLTTAQARYTAEWATNPNTSTAWTGANITSLQIGQEAV